MDTMPRPKLKRDWEGLRVRLLKEHETVGGSIFPAGTEMVVTRNFGGLHLSYVEACDKCRLKYRGRIRGIGESQVEIVGKENG